MKLTRFILVVCVLCSGSLVLKAQYDKAQYEFSMEKEVGCTTVKSQDRTGTCWSFATCSFMESELIRTGKPNYDLSEMFVVKNIYKDKAQNYVLRQGKANFSQGSLSHDFIKTVARHGIVPESVYSGKEKPEMIHNHSEMVAGLKGFLDAMLKQKKLSPKWKTAFNVILDTYIGAYPETFMFEGKEYTPKSFAKSLGLNPKDYVTLTSYTHHPFYEKFVLEIPDNYSNESYYNVPLDEMKAIVDYAINEGFSVAWDGDVSEKGFSAKEGIAVLPVDNNREDLFEAPGAEIKVTQDSRQASFESYSTTDDHLMHFTGVAKDKSGNRYYRVKNSWGEIGPFEGYIYMSEAYFKDKTVGIMVHKDAIPKDLAAKLAL